MSSLRVTKLCSLLLVSSSLCSGLGRHLLGGHPRPTPPPSSRRGSGDPRVSFLCGSGGAGGAGSTVRLVEAGESRTVCYGCSAKVLSALYSTGWAAQPRVTLTCHDEETDFSCVLVGTICKMDSLGDGLWQISFLCLFSHG